MSERRSDRHTESDAYEPRVVHNFSSRGRIGSSRGRNRLLFNRNIAQNVLNCEKVGGASEKSRRGFRPPPPLADNPDEPTLHVAQVG